MACEQIRLPNGATTIVCTSGRRALCACGHPSCFQCDWKVKEHRSGTCDAHLCARCATEVGADKHLCPVHETAFQHWRQDRADRDRLSHANEEAERADQ